MGRQTPVPETEVGQVEPVRLLDAHCGREPRVIEEQKVRGLFRVHLGVDKRGRQAGSGGVDGGVRIPDRKVAAPVHSPEHGAGRVEPDPVDPMRGSQLLAHPAERLCQLDRRQWMGRVHARATVHGCGKEGDLAARAPCGIEWTRGMEHQALDDLGVPADTAQSQAV